MPSSKAPTLSRGEPGAGGGWGTVSEVVVGEITTRLLMVSEALPAETARSVLAAAVPGGHPDRAGHPIERVTSANLPIYVDCHLAIRSGARIPMTGVVASRA